VGEILDVRSPHRRQLGIDRRYDLVERRPWMRLAPAPQRLLDPSRHLHLFSRLVPAQRERKTLVGTPWSDRETGLTVQLDNANSGGPVASHRYSRPIARNAAFVGSL